MRPTGVRVVVDLGRRRSRPGRSAPAASAAWPCTSLPLSTVTSIACGDTDPGRQAAEDVEDRLGLAHQRELHRRRRPTCGGSRWGSCSRRARSESKLRNFCPRPSRSPASRSSSRRTLSTPADTRLVERDRVAEPLGHGLGDGAADEDLLAGDAAEVGGGVAVPAAVVALVLEVPGAGELAGLLAVEHAGSPPRGSTGRCGCRARGRRTRAGCRPRRRRGARSPRSRSRRSG